MVQRQGASISLPDREHEMSEMAGRLLERIRLIGSSLRSMVRRFPTTLVAVVLAAAAWATAHLLRAWWSTEAWWLVSLALFLPIAVQQLTLRALIAALVGTGLLLGKYEL